ncbi:hypothetical protein [Dyella sp. 2HG41-7]|uniref:hypothetical protein n=1 Tax=Dyella sp. 2HG41-7 TaxID=2883239 RepID=UPI001F3F79EF|nr:hypothetical protein [Dyella sp. 2HG41-7]
MKTIATCFAVLGLALSATTFAPVGFAQDSSAPASMQDASSTGMQHRAPDPQKQAARLSKRLGLNDDQSSKIASILQNRQQQLMATRSDSSLSPQDRRAKMRSIQQNTDSQINAVLTPDQQSQYATMKQNMKNRRQNARGNPNGSSSSDNGSDSDSH